MTDDDLREIEAMAAAIIAKAESRGEDYDSYALALEMTRQDIPALTMALREAWGALGIPGVALYAPADFAWLNQENARLRSLLAALVSETAPDGDTDYSCYCCLAPAWKEHKPDCPWLLAKQYLDGRD